jgi:hypothetical protein
MSYVEVLDTDIDSPRLFEDFMSVLRNHELLEHQQISITSINGNNDWLCSVGKIRDLQYPERFYSKINDAFKGTYVEELISRYPQYYRWRAMRLQGRSTYSVHADNEGYLHNYRVHIPVFTTEKCFLCFFDKLPESGKSSVVHYEHLPIGQSYKVNTTNLHTAVNYGIDNRYHIVGVRYENSDNGTQ